MTTSIPIKIPMTVVISKLTAGLILTPISILLAVSILVMMPNNVQTISELSYGEMFSRNKNKLS